MTEPATITCPVCDAPNGPRSLFCAECGTPLTSAGEDDGATRHSPAITDSQSTAVIPSSRSWAEPVPAVSSDPLDTGFAPAEVILAPDPSPYFSSPNHHPESRRGFWLGLVAVILILVILGLWIWGGVLAADTRDSVRDLFS